MKKKILALCMCFSMLCSMGTAGCGKQEKNGASVEESSVYEETSVSEEKNTEVSSEISEEEIPEGDFIELALNVYYNDGINGYYANESGKSIYVTDNGTYSLSFDCSADLSEDAVNAGVSSLTNLTAIYILDMGVAKKAQSALSSCNIKYESIIVDGKELTITQKEAKSAFKSSGIFDTNDPINAWDGSLVEEVEASEKHEANFTTVSNPKVITVTFTLSDMVWGIKEAEEVSADSNTDFTNTAVFSNIDFTDVDALSLTKYMGNGINLGNTMEAYGRANFGTSAAVKTYETYWGQPVTTKEMFAGMKNSGFDTVRIPVAWTNMMNYESGDYTIDSALLDRVEEIVNFALDEEMFVIINDHWDGGWWARFGAKDENTAAAAMDMYEAMWTQIAERFKDYSDMLIFEAANEELGDRLNDTGDYSGSGALTKNELYEMTTKINQKFIDVVRKSGGNNDDRFLLVAGYNTDIERTCDNRYVMPVDTATNKLLLSVHYYTPWNYCGSDKQAKWGLEKDIKEMNRLLKMMTKYTNQGYGIVIGEYAALPTGGGELKTNTALFTENFLDNCDIYNYASCLWSCNDLYSKTTKTMKTEELASIYTGRCYASELAAGDAYTDSVKKNMDDRLANVPQMWEGVETYEAGTPVAWIMWNGGAGTYSVGDTFNPADNTAGIKATNAVIEGAGEYTVSLDFENGNDGLTFAALGIADGETLFPGMIILIEEITLNGEKTEMIAYPYTSSDDGKCTRVNLVNEWVTGVPDGARSIQGLANASAVILDKTKLNGLKNITIKFRVIIM